MNPSLAKALLADRQSGVQLLYGVATATNTVEIAGSTVGVELPAIEDVFSGDYVAVLAAGADRLILGRVGGTVYRYTGTVAVDGSGFWSVTHGLGVVPAAAVAVSTQVSFPTVQILDNLTSTIASFKNIIPTTGASYTSTSIGVSVVVLR